MESDILLQSYIFFVFILGGFIIAIIFDIFRILRKNFKTGDIITYIEDVLFWIIAGSITLHLIFTFNNGELRFYIFIGLLIGIIIYIVFFSKIFIKVSSYILNIIKRVISIVFLPIKKVTKYIIYISKSITDFFKKIQKNVKKLFNFNFFLQKKLKISKKEGK